MSQFPYDSGIERKNKCTEVVCAVIKVDHFKFILYNFSL